MAHMQSMSPAGVVTFRVPSREEVGALPIIRAQVPLSLPHNHIFKQLEIVQQPKSTLLVAVDRSCVFAPDQWNQFLICSPQTLGVACPCCYPAAVAPLPLWFQQVIQRDLLCDATGRRAKAAVAVPAAVADGPMPPYHVILEFMVRKLIANLPDSFPVEQKPDVPPFSWYCSDAEDPHFKIIEGIQTAVAASDRKSFGELHDGET